MGVAGRPLDNYPRARGSFYTPRLRQIITLIRGREGRGAGDSASEAARSAEKAFLLQTRPSLAFTPRKGCLPFGFRPQGSESGSWRVSRAPERCIRASSFSTRGWTAPGPESPWGGFPRATRLPSPTQLELNSSDPTRWRPGDEAGFAEGWGGITFPISPGG